MLSAIPVTSCSCVPKLFLSYQLTVVPAGPGGAGPAVGRTAVTWTWVVESSVDTVLEGTVAATSLSGPVVHGRALSSPGQLWPPALAVWAPALLCPSPVGLLPQAGAPSQRVRPHVLGCRR